MGTDTTAKAASPLEFREHLGSGCSRSSFAGRPEVGSGSRQRVRISNMAIAFLQTSDAAVYYPMLQETSKTVRRYCLLNGFQYIQYVGIKAGNMPWKAIHNRIFMLKELLDARFSGWAFYLDADCFIADLNFDLASYLADKEQHAGIFAGHLHGVPYNVNSGGFAVNFRHPIGRQLVLDFYEAFADTEKSVFDHAVYWGRDLPGDQFLLHSVLRRYVEELSLGGYFLFEQYKKSYVNDGPFIKQALRAHFATFADRLLAIKAEVKLALGADTADDPVEPPGLGHFNASHPRLHTAIGTKNDFGICTDGKADGFLLYGPYIDVAAGDYTVEIRGKILEIDVSSNRRFDCDIAFDRGRVVVSKSTFPIEDTGNFVIEHSFVLNEAVSGLEVRVIAFKGVKARIFALKFLQKWLKPVDGATNGRELVEINVEDRDDQGNRSRDRMSEVIGRAGDLDVQQVPDGYIIYQSGRDTGCYLNKTAAIIFEFCDGQRGADEIVARVAKIFDLDVSAHAEIRGCIASLIKEGLVQSGAK